MQKTLPFVLIPLLALSLLGLGLSACRGLMSSTPMLEPIAQAGDDHCRAMCRLGQDERPGLFESRGADPAPSAPTAVASAFPAGPSASIQPGTPDLDPRILPPARSDLYLRLAVLLI